MTETVLYRKSLLQPMRPYVLGEDLSGVSVNAEDTPEEGGMVAWNPDNPKDQWYVAKRFFEENYEPAIPEGKVTLRDLVEDALTVKTVPDYRMEAIRAWATAVSAKCGDLNAYETEEVIDILDRIIELAGGER